MPNRLAIIAVVVLAASTGCSAQQKSGSNAAITPDIARRVELKIRSQFNLPPNVSVNLGELRPSEIAGFDTLPITLSDGQRSTTHNFLLSQDRKTLANLSRMDISKDPMADINVDGRPVLGNPQAKVTIVNYDDFQCPYCSNMHTTLMQGIAKSYGDKVKIIYKDYPLESIHPWAIRAAVNANCLAAQKGAPYWEYADFAHSEQKALNSALRAGGNAHVKMLDDRAMEIGTRHGLDMPKLQACVKAQDESAVRASMQEGSEVGVEATPTLFINGEKVSGAVPEPELRAIVERALRNAGVDTGATGAAAPQPKQ